MQELMILKDVMLMLGYRPSTVGSARDIEKRWGINACGMVGERKVYDRADVQRAIDSKASLRKEPLVSRLPRGNTMERFTLNDRKRIDECHAMLVAITKDLNIQIAENSPASAE